MSGINLKVDIRGINKALKRISAASGKIDRASSIAANRALKKAHTDGKKEAKTIFNIKAKDVQQKHDITPTRPGNLKRGKLVYDDQRRGLHKWGAKSKGRGKARAHGGITYEVTRGKRKAIQPGWVWHSHPNKIALIRKSKDSQQTKLLTGPDVAQVMSNKKVTKAIEQARDKTFDKEFDRQLRRVKLL